MKWTILQEKKLITLADCKMSVEEMKKDFPSISAGSIANKLIQLRREGKISSEFKIRMKKWDEKKLIDLANKGLTVQEIANYFPNTTTGTIIGRLATLKNEGKLSKGFVIRQVKPSDTISKSSSKYLKDIDERISKKLELFEFKDKKEDLKETESKKISFNDLEGEPEKQEKNGMNPLDNENSSKNKISFHDEGIQRFDITHTIEKLSSLEEKCRIKLLNLSAFSQIEKNSLNSVYIYGEAYSVNEKTIQNDISIRAAIYDFEGKLLDFDDTEIYSDQFEDFTLFKIKIEKILYKPAIIKIYPILL